MKASEIARLVGGTLEGEADPELFSVAPLDRAQGDQLTFLADPRYLSHLPGACAGAVLVGRPLSMRGSTSLPRIVVEDVARALATILTHLHPELPPRPGIHPTAVLGHGVALGEEVTVGAYTVIGDHTRIGAGSVLGAQVVIGQQVTLAEQVRIHPGAVLYDRVRVGARTIVHSGARLGSDGFGYVQANGQHEKVPQVGDCVIGADVEIGANTTIDRGSVGATEIGDGVKIDNLVHIGHNVRVGPHSIIVAQVGISGSVVLGSRVTLAGQVGIVGHLRIADHVTVAGKSVVWSTIDQPGVYSGNPARPHKETLRVQAALARLPQLLKRLSSLEQAVFGSARARLRDPDPE